MVYPSSWGKPGFWLQTTEETGFFAVFWPCMDVVGKTSISHHASHYRTAGEISVTRRLSTNIGQKPRSLNVFTVAVAAF